MVHADTEEPFDEYQQLITRRKAVSYIVVVRQGFVNAWNALGADQVMQVLRQTRKFFIFLLLFLCFLSLLTEKQ